jgi:hypothetical protein
MAKTWKVTLKLQKSVKRGNTSIAIRPGISFNVTTSSDSQPQGPEIQKPFLIAVGADSVCGSVSSSDFKIEKL